MMYSASTSEEGIITDLVPEPNVGCSGSDFGASVHGNIALVKRDECSFEQQSNLAYRAGAAALLVYNDQEGDLLGTLDQDVANVVPTADISMQDGETLLNLIANTSTPVLIRLTRVEFHQERRTANVCAETKVSYQRY